MKEVINQNITHIRKYAYLIVFCILNTTEKPSDFFFLLEFTIELVVGLAYKPDLPPAGPVKLPPNLLLRDGNRQNLIYIDIPVFCLFWYGFWSLLNKLTYLTQDNRS